MFLIISEHSGFVSAGLWNLNVNVPIAWISKMQTDKCLTCMLSVVTLKAGWLSERLVTFVTGEGTQPQMSLHVTKQNVTLWKDLQHTRFTQWKLHLSLFCMSKHGAYHISLNKPTLTIKQLPKSWLIKSYNNKYWPFHKIFCKVLLTQSQNANLLALKIYTNMTARTW